MQIEEIDPYMVAVNDLNTRGNFLIAFARCWLSADLENKIIMKSSAIELIKKYGLDEDLKRKKEKGNFN